MFVCSQSSSTPTKVKHYTLVAVIMCGIYIASDLLQEILFLITGCPHDSDIFKGLCHGI